MEAQKVTVTNERKDSLNILLTRADYLQDGILGNMTDEKGRQLFATLEHSFPFLADGGYTYAPALPPGTYTCQRGQHQLAHMTAPFETFEVMNVPGHTNILIHMGNYNADSEGCILVGSDVRIENTVHMVANSQLSFTSFMNLQQLVNTFTLTVS
jgi:hypothetical protein